MAWFFRRHRRHSRIIHDLHTHQLQRPTNAIAETKKKGKSQHTKWQHKYLMSDALNAKMKQKKKHFILNYEMRCVRVIIILWRIARNNEQERKHRRPQPIFSAQSTYSWVYTGQWARTAICEKGEANRRQCIEQTKGSDHLLHVALH